MPTWSTLSTGEDKLTAMTTVSVKNNTACDMVIAPGTRIGGMDIVTGRDTAVLCETNCPTVSGNAGAIGTAAAKMISLATSSTIR